MRELPASARVYVAENPKTSALAVAAAVLLVVGLCVGIYFLVRHFQSKESKESEKGDDAPTPTPTPAPEGAEAWELTVGGATHRLERHLDSADGLAKTWFASDVVAGASYALLPAGKELRVVRIAAGVCTEIAPSIDKLPPGTKIAKVPTTKTYYFAAVPKCVTNDGAQGAKDAKDASVVPNAGPKDASVVPNAGPNDAKASTGPSAGPKDADEGDLSPST
jgi:hypothetical protein